MSSTNEDVRFKLFCLNQSSIRHNLKVYLYYPIRFKQEQYSKLKELAVNTMFNFMGFKPKEYMFMDKEQQLTQVRLLQFKAIKFILMLGSLIKARVWVLPQRVKGLHRVSAGLLGYCRL